VNNKRFKFRAWIKKEKYMLDHRQLMNKFLDLRGNNRKYDPFNDPSLIVMQRTGLMDKQGKDIYDGDIVAYWDEELNAPETGSISKVIFERGYFKGQYPINHIRYYLDASFVEQYEKIIGNVYENPELFK